MQKSLNFAFCLLLFVGREDEIASTQCLKIPQKSTSLKNKIQMRAGLIFKNVVFELSCQNLTLGLLLFQTVLT